MSAQTPLSLFQTKNYHNAEFWRKFLGHSSYVEDLMYEMNPLETKERVLTLREGEMACG